MTKIGPAVLPEPADRRADLRRRGAAGAADRRARRRGVADAAVPAQARTDHAAVDDARRGLEDLAGGGEVLHRDLRPGRADGAVHAVRHGAEHFVSGFDRRRQQPRRRVRSRPRHGVRDGAQRRDDRAAVRDALVRRAAVVRQDQDAVRLLPRSRRLSRATRRRGPSCSASTPTPATSCGACRSANTRS